MIISKPKGAQSMKKFFCKFKAPTLEQEIQTFYKLMKKSRSERGLLDLIYDASKKPNGVLLLKKIQELIKSDLEQLDPATYFEADVKCQLNRINHLIGCRYYEMEHGDVILLHGSYHKT